jgi:putative ABC transport system permease protein
MNRDQAGLMGMDGLTNQVYVEPAPGYTQNDVQYALFHLPGIASVRPIAVFSEMFDQAMGLLTAFMTLVALAVLVMAFLIAFNSTSINVDERAREIATLFAFGLPIRTVLRMTVLENLITGILGTLLGIGLGWGVLNWMLTSQVDQVVPHVNLALALTPLTLAIAVILGVLVVALTPLLNLNKLSRMNLPATLRVVE